MGNNYNALCIDGYIEESKTEPRSTEIKTPS